ncbi:MAG: sodium:solute symporter family protein, partial [Alphaproteobacteria bacterium]
ARPGCGQGWGQVALIWISIIFYVAVQLAIGVWASRRVHTEGDYLLAGRRLGLGLASVSLFATWFGAETVMGSSAAVAEQGLAGGRADPFGYAICLFLMAIFLAYQMRRRNYVTLGDFFRERYSPLLERVAVLVLLPAVIIWAAAQLLAFGQILNVLTEVPLALSLVAATVLVILYTTLGGLWGDVVTDAVQGAVLVIGLVILLGFVLAAAGGIGAGIAAIEPGQLRLVAPDETGWARLELWMIPILGSLVSQEALSRLLAARSPAIARRACFAAAGVYLALGLIPVTIALVGAHLAPDLAHRDQFLPVLAANLLPPVLFAILIGALLSAILSTVDSTLLTASALVSHNLVVRALPRLSEKGRVRSARIIVVLAGLAAYAIARGDETILDLVVLASSFGTAGLLVTVLFGLWTRRGGPMTALAALIVGFAVTLWGEALFALEAPFMTAIGAAALTFLLGAFIRPRPEAA